MSYNVEDLRDMYNGTLPWNKTFEIMSKPKDNDRFDKYIQILQEKVSYSEKILMPLGEHLNVVQKETERVVKCDCGHEFGDWRQNWKLQALIFSRDDNEKLEEIYPGIKRPDPNLCEVREFYCPTCGAMLMVEAVPIGCPLVFDALPDIDTFYRDWLGNPLPDEKEFKDMTYDITRKWGEEIS